MCHHMRSEFDVEALSEEERRELLAEHTTEELRDEGIEVDPEKVAA